jgi:hypothetical protein
MLTQKEIDRTEKQVIAGHWIRSASAGYRHFRWQGRIRRIVDLVFKGIKTESNLDFAARESRKGYQR